MSPFMHLAIWGLLIARLLIPVTLESSVHLIVIPAETQNAAMPEASQPPVSNSVAVDTSDIVQPQPRPPQTKDGQAQAAAAPAMAADKPSARQQTFTLSTEKILLAVWVTGAGIGFIYLAALYGLLRRRIQRNAQPPSRRLLELFAEVKAELNIRRNVKIIGQCEYGTPAVLFPNTVLMPVDTLVSMSDEKVKFVLRHELMHFKRGDHILGLALSVLNAIYWFNPIVWIAFKLIRADMETACDSDVVRMFSSDEKSTYATVILSLFSKKQYGNLVVGMVQGNIRKVAEKRIRGVFMNHKTDKKVKATAILLTGLLLLTCFTTACQPTPETPPVIHRKEDIPKEAILETGKPQPTKVKNAVEPAAYSVLEHWTETVKKNDFLSIEVDADILMPDAAAYPVERLERTVLTQERVNELIAYFTPPGTKFYTGEHVKLKSEYEEELIDLRKSLQDVLNGGDGEGDPESIRAEIEEVERKMALAPESHNYTYVEPVFTYTTDYETGAPRKEYGENTIRVSIELPDGDRNGSIFASRYEKGKNKGSEFIYRSFSGDWFSESYFTMYDDELKWEMENPPWGENADVGQWQKEIEIQRKFVDAGLKRMQENKMDLSEAADRAIRVLEELGIGGMQLKSYEKAMFSRERNGDYTIPACYVEFVRECGGIPSHSQRGGFVSHDWDLSQLYCAPFEPESVTMLVSEEGVEYFTWSGMAQVVERVAENTTLLPLDQMKQRILDYVYFVNAGYPREMRVKIEEMRLVTTYINAKDDPERVLIVPAWCITTQDEYLFDHTGTWGQAAYGQGELMINALDGSGILMPGILEIAG